MLHNPASAGAGKENRNGFFIKKDEGGKIRGGLPFWNCEVPVLPSVEQFTHCLIVPCSHNIFNAGYVSCFRCEGHQIVA